MVLILTKSTSISFFAHGMLYNTLMICHALYFHAGHKVFLKGSIDFPLLTFLAFFILKRVNLLSFSSNIRIISFASLLMLHYIVSFCGYPSQLMFCFTFKPFIYNYFSFKSRHFFSTDVLFLTLLSTIS